MRIFVAIYDIDTLNTIQYFTKILIQNAPDNEVYLY